MTKTDIAGASRKERRKIKKACLENAKWLLAKANDNFHLQNFGLATFLAITAYEESLKFGLLNSNLTKILSDEEYNKIASSHIPKLLSKYASVVMYEDGKKLDKNLLCQRKILILKM